MAKIVELCGAPGVGKSTLFKEMKRAWKKENNWVPGPFLYPQEKIRLAALSRMLFKIERRFTESEGNVDERILKVHGDRFVHQNQEYMDACWTNVSRNNSGTRLGKDLRFQKVKYLYHTIERYQFLREIRINKIAILDEGIVHRTVNGLFRGQDPEEDMLELKKQINIMPLPDALIYIGTDAAEAARRLLSRKKVISAHQALGFEELEQSSRSSIERLTFAVATLERNGVPVLWVNSHSGLSENAHKIIKFIEGLN